MAVLNLKDIRIDGGTQAREKLDTNLVDQYSEEMSEGDVFPPLIVYHDGSSYWLADGFHRFFASKKIDRNEIEAEVRQGTRRDAQLFALSANRRRGLHMSPADIRKSVIIMLKDEEWSKWSSREIAKHVGSSNKTVSRIRADLEVAGEIKKNESVVYVDKHGQETTMTTRKKEKTPQQELIEEEKPEQPEEKPVDPRDQHIAELADTINALEAENQRLRDAIAVGQWDASDIEKIDAQETINELREQIRLLEIDNAALRDSRDMYQTRNAELMKSVKSMTAKLKRVA